MKYFKKFNQYVFEKTESDASIQLKNVLKNKRNLIDEYKELLKKHSVSIKNDVLDSTQVEYKRIFLAMCVTYKIYNIDILKKYTSKIESKYKDINNIYVNYYQEELKNKENLIAKVKVELDAKEKQEIKDKASTIAKEEANKTAQETNNIDYVLTEDDKKLLTTPKILETVYFGRKIANKPELISFINRFFNIKNNITILSQDTDDAIKNYQKNKGLTVDGKIGVETWKKIYEQLGIPFQENYINPLVKKNNTNVKPKVDKQTSVNNLLSTTKNSTITDLNNMFEGLLLEKIDTLDGIEMIVRTPYDSKTNKIEVAFKKDGKYLTYKSPYYPKGTTYIFLDVNPKTGKFSTKTKDNLLKGLTMDTTPTTPTTPTTNQEVFKGDMNNIVDEIIEEIDGYTGAGAISNIYNLLLKLQDKNTKKSKLFYDEFDEKNIDAYQYFLDAYKRDEGGDDFEDDLNNTGLTTFNSDEISQFNKLIKLIKQMNPNSNLERK